MGAFDIAVIVVISVAVVAVVASLIYKKIRHKGGACDCGCSDCACCDKCKNKK